MQAERFNSLFHWAHTFRESSEAITAQTNMPDWLEPMAATLTPQSRKSLRPS
jgi:hypothetical protein